MRAFIKDKYTFETLIHCLVEDYDIKESIYETVSEIRIVTPDNPLTEGNILIIQEINFVGIISNISVEEGTTVLSCEQAVTLFNRDIFFDSANITYVEDYLADLIDTYYINESDEAFQLGYITLNVSTHTSGDALPDVDNNIFTVKSYASKIRRLYGVHCIFSFDHNHLFIDIRKIDNGIKQIDFSNPSFRLISQDFSKETVAKITTYCAETTKEQNWYLMDDDSITSDVPVDGALWALQHQDLTFYDLSVSGFTQESTPTYTAFPFKKEVTIRGVTSDMEATVTTNPDDTNQIELGMIETAYNKAIFYATKNISIVLPQVIFTPKK